MRNKLLLVSVLIIVCLGPISNARAIPAMQDQSVTHDIPSSDSNTNGFMPINYQIYDNYANGSSKLLGLRNSMDRLQVQPDSASYPFGGNTVTLGGSNNLAYLNYAGFSMMQEVGTYTSSLDKIAMDPNIYTSSSTYPTQTAVGDFDGDHQPDMITLDYTGSVVLLAVYTHFATYHSIVSLIKTSPISLVVAGNQFIGSIYQIQNPQIVAGNFDNDPMSEFAMLYIDNSGVQQVRVFDDLMHSHIMEPIHYGDYISLEEVLAGTYVKSTGTAISAGTNNAYQQANWTTGTPIQADPSLTFRIVDPNNLSSTAQIGYGYQVSLQDKNGNYLSDDQGYALISSSLTNKEIFTIRSENKDGTSDAAIYETNTIALQGSDTSTTATFLSVDDNGNALFGGFTAASPYFDFKILSANALQDHYAVDPTTYATTFSVTGMSVGLPQTTETDMLKGGSLNLMSTNVDSDNRSELVVAGLDGTGHAVAYVFDDQVAGYTLLHSFYWQHEKGVFPNIADGDMNGDGMDELIFSYSNQTNAAIYIYNNQFQLVHTITDVNPSDFPTVKLADLDNDGSAELVYVDQGSNLSIYDDQNNNFNPILHNYFVFNTNDVSGDNFSGFGIDNQTRIQSFAASFPQLELGDFNVDGTLEIGLGVFAQDNIPNPHFITVVFSVSNKLHLLDYQIENYDYPTTLVAGDFDSDSYTVEYTGNHTLFTTPGELLAIAVASPVQARINQNYDDSNTLFGTSVSQSSTVDNEFSTSYGAFIKFEQEIAIFGIKLAQFETQAGFSYAMGVRNIQTSTTAMTTEFHGDAADDTVIYTTALYDMYTFNVISSKYPGQIGRVITVSIPNAPALYKQHRSYYNDNTNGVNAVINSSIIPSTAGNLTSYMSHDQMNAYIQSYGTGTAVQSDEVQVGQGEGYNTVKIDISQENTTGFSQDYSFDFEASGGVFGLSVGVTFGLTTTHAYETTMGQSTSFGLDVGDIINAQDYNDYRYGFGLAVYQVNIKNHGAIQSPWMINSWVNLPSTWTAPPLETTNTGTSGTLSDSVNESTSSSGLFGLPFNFFFFAIGLIPIELLRKRENSKTQQP